MNRQWTGPLRVSWVLAAGAFAMMACGSDEPATTSDWGPATVALAPEIDATLPAEGLTPDNLTPDSVSPDTGAADSTAPAASEGTGTTAPTVVTSTGATTTEPNEPTESTEPTETTEPKEPETSCESVIHVGDSTSVSLISPSFLEDPGQRVNAQYRRVGASDARTEIDGALSTRETLDGQTNAFDRVSAIKAAGYEGCWVFALGGNDTANVSAMAGGPSRVQRIETMMSAIDDDPVMWVNVRTLRTSSAYRNDNMLLWNEALQEVLPQHPNMRVFDWASVVQEEWFQDDGIHYTSSGSAYRAALIANALAAEFPA